MRISKQIIVRRAVKGDAENIRALQNATFRIAALAQYDASDIDSFLRHAGTLEPALIDDGTYFVAEIEGEIVASGGWSSRTATYAGFIRSGAVAPSGSAVIRGVYVDPAYLAAGLAQRIFEIIEEDIASRGYDGAHLATTYTGMPFYNAADSGPIASLLSHSPTAMNCMELPCRRAFQGPCRPQPERTRCSETHVCFVLQWHKCMSIFNALFMRVYFDSLYQMRTMINNVRLLMNIASTI